MKDIEKLDTLKLYFPYLGGRLGASRTLRCEMEWLLAYALFADCIICPPNSLFGQPHGIDNLATIQGNKLLREVFARGIVITTTTDCSIGGVDDLVTEYSRVSAQYRTGIEMTIYLRSKLRQCETSSQYMLKFIQSSVEIPDKTTNLLSNEFSHYPDSVQTNILLEKIKSDLSPALFHTISKEANNSYFLAGSIGNGAIMPPLANGYNSHLYDHMYSKAAVAPFLLKIQQVLKSNLTSVSTEQYLALRRRLIVFRHLYHDLSNCCKNCYSEVISLISKKYAFSNACAPVVMTQALTATILALATGPLFATALDGLYVLGKLSWETISKALKINDQLSARLLNILGSLGILPKHQKEVSEILIKFENAILECIPH